MPPIAAGGRPTTSDQRTTLGFTRDWLQAYTCARTRRLPTRPPVATYSTRRHSHLVDQSPEPARGVRDPVLSLAFAYGRARRRCRPRIEESSLGPRLAPRGRAKLTTPRGRLLPLARAGAYPAYSSVATSELCRTVRHDRAGGDPAARCATISSEFFRGRRSCRTLAGAYVLWMLVDLLPLLIRGTCVADPADSLRNVRRRTRRRSALFWRWW